VEDFPVIQANVAQVPPFVIRDIKVFLSILEATQRGELRAVRTVSEAIRFAGEYTAQQ